MSAKLGSASERVLGEPISIAVRKYIANTISDFTISSNSAAGTSLPLTKDDSESLC